MTGDLHLQNPKILMFFGCLFIFLTFLPLALRFLTFLPAEAKILTFLQIITEIIYVYVSPA